MNFLATLLAPARPPAVAHEGEKLQRLRRRQSKQRKRLEQHEHFGPPTRLDEHLPPPPGRLNEHFGPPRRLNEHLPPPAGAANFPGSPRALPRAAAIVVHASETAL